MIFGGNYLNFCKTLHKDWGSVLLFYLKNLSIFVYKLKKFKKFLQLKKLSIDDIIYEIKNML